MTEMRRMRLLMVAIRCCRCPGELERQSDKQKNEKQFFHGTDNSTSGCGVFDVTFVPTADIGNPVVGTGSRDLYSFSARQISRGATTPSR